MKINILPYIKKIIIFLIILIICSLGLCSKVSAGEKKPIYFEIEKNPIESVHLSVDNASPICGEKVKMNIDVYPESARLTVLDKSYKIIEGGNYSSINGEFLQINENAPVGSNILLSAEVDGVKSDNIVSLTIQNTNVEYLEIINKEKDILVGSSIKLETKIYPHNSTNKFVKYLITSGGEIAEVSYSGILTIKRNINLNNYSSVTVEAISLEDESIKAQKTFNIVEPIIETINANEDLKYVEPARTYSFSIINEPFSSMFGNKAVYYNVDCNQEIATMYLNGQLYISPNAKIGSKFNVIITSSDNFKYQQTLEVVDVYATDFEPVIKTSPTYKIGDKEYYLPGDVIEFDVINYYPFNVTEKNKVFELKSSDTSIATIEYNKVRISSNISVNNPSVSINLISYPNDLEESFKIDIYVPVDRVELSKKVEEIYENSSTLIESIISSEIYPLNSSSRDIIYKLTDSSKQFSYIEEILIDGVVHTNIITKPDISINNPEIGIYAIADGIKSDVILIPIYKPARNLELEYDSDNSNPISSTSLGGTIYFTSNVNPEASKNDPTFNVINGQEYIDGAIKFEETFQDGKKKWSIKIKKNLSSIDAPLRPIIISSYQLHNEKFEVSSQEISINIYIPDEDLNIKDEYVVRGNIKKLNIVHTNNASNTRYEWKVSQKSQNDFNVLKVDGSVDEFYVPTSMKAGEKIYIEYRSLDTEFFGNNIPWKTVTFTVSSFDNPLFVSSFDNAPLEQNKFNICFETDSNGIVIGKSQSTPQLMIERTAKIILFYSNKKIGEYGLSIDSITVDNGICTSYDVDSLVIMPNKDAYYGSLIKINIRIRDGENIFYNIVSNDLHVYRKLSGLLSFDEVTKNGVKISTFVNTYTSSFDFKAIDDNLDSFDFKILNNSGISLDKNYVNVNSYAANPNQIIEYTCSRYYNNSELDYIHQNTYVHFKTVELNCNGGNENYNIISLSNMRQDLILPSSYFPTRVGYIFDGYESYIDEQGNTIDDFSNKRIIYANWKPITYRIVIGLYVTDAGSWATNAVEQCGVETAIYDQTFFLDSNYFLLKDQKEYDEFYGWQYTDKDGNKQTIETKEDLYPVINLREKQDDLVDCYALFRSKNSSCIATGTKITLADGSYKNVENLDGTESLLVWNLYTGKFDVAPMIFIDYHGDHEYETIYLNFSDGSYVEVIDEHGFWDIDLRKYVYLDSNNSFNYIGHRFFKQTTDENNIFKSEVVTLENVENKNELTGAWSPVTYQHMCYFVNGLLSVPAETEGFTNIFEISEDEMKYDEIKMKEDINHYGLFSYENDFSNLISKEVFEAFNGQYLKVSIIKGLLTEEKLLWLIEHYSKYLKEEENE